jgi:hypothetical protein
LVTRIGEMLAYQSYNTKSPLNGEAAKWVDQNIERLPLDSVNMHLEDTAPAAPAPSMGAPRTAPPPPPLPRVAAPTAAPRPATMSPPPIPSTAGAPAAPPIAARIVTCPGCAAKIRAKPELGAQIRCPRCKTVISLA